MKRAILDEGLTAVVVSERALRYTTPAVFDRPAHVRAASALAFVGDRLFVLQDDTTFLGVVDGEHVDAIAMPGELGVVEGAPPNDTMRRRFEDAIGNRLDKPDFEACVVIDGRLFAFGSGSLPVREWIYRRSVDDHAMVHAPRLYHALREVLGAINLEGAALVRDELWLFHRGNASASDRPAVARLPRDDFERVVRGLAPSSLAIDHFDLGAVDHTRFGFTDATSRDDRVLVACAAEASPDAIADGVVIGSRLGVLDHDVVRCANVVDRDGSPIKLEGVVLDPRRSNTAWITIDPDDPAVPARLCEVRLAGNWLF